MDETNRNTDDQLQRRIARILLSRGVKATTMDSVSAELGISKRTLYEIFESKTDMVMKTQAFIERVMLDRAAQIMAEAPNVLVGLRNVSYDHVDFIDATDVRFFSDMHEFMEAQGIDHEERRRNHVDGLFGVCMSGVEQGVFRPELDYLLQIDLLQIQMEALKRVEVICGPGRSLAAILRLVCDSFLRAIATRKGLDIIDELEASSKPENTNSPIL